MLAEILRRAGEREIKMAAGVNFLTHFCTNFHCFFSCVMKVKRVKSFKSFFACDGCSRNREVCQLGPTEPFFRFCFFRVVLFSELSSCLSSDFSDLLVVFRFFWSSVLVVCLPYEFDSMGFSPRLQTQQESRGADGGREPRERPERHVARQGETKNWEKMMPRTISRCKVQITRSVS